MCWQGRWADRECLWATKASNGRTDDANGTIDEGNIALVHSTNT